jgi:3'(2'), 5'-bisphosphate nucleotidase
VPYELLEEVVSIARLAGDVVLEVYERGCAPTAKDDGSPVTEADHRAQELICERLGELLSDVPIVAEESYCADTAGPAASSFWLVDPLDGTKEFLGRSREFTVNVALVRAGVPVLGVIHAPALDRMYTASGARAWIDDRAGRRAISARAIPEGGATVVSSRSHGDPDALRRFMSGRSVAASITAGSSLKFCLLAAGEADLYPRFGRTMEWDTAAGDAILRAAGGRVTDLEGRALGYGKPGFENPYFVALGREQA